MTQPQRKVWRMTKQPNGGLADIGTTIVGRKVNLPANQINLPGSRRKHAPGGPVVTPQGLEVTQCPSPTYDARYQSAPGSEVTGPFGSYPPGINPETGRPW